MNRSNRKGMGRCARFLACLVLLGGLAGCDDDWDYTPPEGMGALIIDNFTGERVRVYLDGAEVNSVSSGHHRTYDLAPGVIRVALDSEDIQRAWADDVDVLEGRLTIMELRSSTYDWYEFDVQIYFD